MRLSSLVELCLGHGRIDSSSAASLNIAVEMLYGPVALRVSKWESCL